MRKPKRKTITLHLPRPVDEAVRLIAKHAGTTRTNVINVLLAIAMLHQKKVFYDTQLAWQKEHDAPVPDPARRPRAR